MLTVISVAGIWFGSEPFLRQAIERYATRLNGAEVSIGEVRLSLFQGRLRLTNIEITHHVQTLRNLVELDSVEVNFIPSALFALRAEIPSIDVKGIRYNTWREHSGIVGEETSVESASTALLDRVAPGIYDTARNPLGRTPLRSLGQLSLGISTKTVVDSLQNEFETRRLISLFDGELDRFASAWEQTRGELDVTAWRKRPQAEVDGEVQRVRALQARMRKEFEALERRLSETQPQMQADVDRVLHRLGLPKLGAPDLTQDLLGWRTIGHLERLSYWIDLSRRKLLPLATEPGTGYSKHASSLGQEILFRQANQKPRLWIGRVTLKSEAGSHPNQGNVDGELTHVALGASQQSMPTRLDLRADFPGLGIEGVRVHALVNHTTGQPHERIQVSVGSFPLDDWTLEESSDLKVSVSGVTSFGLESDFRADKISAAWSAQVRNPEFSPRSRNRPFEATLRELFGSLPNPIEIRGGVSGTPGKLDFELTSNLGRDLASSLNNRFRVELASTQESIRTDLEERFTPGFTKLRKRLQSKHAQIQERLSEFSRLIQNPAS